MAPPKKTLIQYEHEAVRDQRTGCLIYTSPVARHVYELRHGRINNSKIAVCHTCDNSFCIEDAHHFLGTWKDNVQDSVEKGRHSCFKNCAKKGEPYRGGAHTKRTKQLISADSTARWREVRKLGLRNLKELSEHVKSS